jgi:hypothetical protein
MVSERQLSIVLACGMLALMGIAGCARAREPVAVLAESTGCHLSGIERFQIDAENRRVSVMRKVRETVSKNDLIRGQSMEVEVMAGELGIEETWRLVDICAGHAVFHVEGTMSGVAVIIVPIFTSHRYERDVVVCPYAPAGPDVRERGGHSAPYE